jgi:hypothetical protein
MEPRMNTIVTDFPPMTTYELCDSSGVKEIEFQEVATRLVSRLYPDSIVFPFHPNVRFDDAVWQPDLAIVDRQLRYWFVVEVEISTHHLEKHVLPQVTAFSEGVYSDDAAKQLSDGVGISHNEARTLLSMIPRDIVVLSNRINENWTRKLASVGVQIMAITTYRNVTTAQAVHRVDGELIPSQYSLGFGRVRAEDSVIVTQTGSFWKEGSYQISGPEGIARWECTVLEGKAWLMKSKGLIEFHDKAIVQFLLRNDGSLAVRLPYPEAFDLDI